LQNYKKAIDYHEIQAFYQPVIRTSTRQLCSFEALARWIDPRIGMIYPDEFIPVLERAGLIHLLDTEILRQVCARIRSSIANGETPIPVSVNLSRLDFRLCDIFALADSIVSDYRIPHDFVYFEITESVMAEQKEMLMGIVDRFRAAGYQIWMDDFGSAYSSLNVLHEFSFDELKLDMSFLKTFNLRSKRIMTAIVKMAKIIDIHTLAEGVETEEQFVHLRDIGCEKVQGYYFGKPMPYGEALDHLQEKGISIEAPKDRNYYDVIGKIDYFSAVPFMTREEYNAIDSARELSSIPLALAEFSADSFKVLFYNSAFEETAHSAGMFTRVFTQEMRNQPQPYHMLTRNILNLLDSVKVDGEGKMLFTINDYYYEIRARLMARTEDKLCVMVRITNLTKDTQMEKTGYLDDSIRQIYALYERITLLNRSEDSIRPLYTDTREDLLGSRKGVKNLVEEYAIRYIYPEDKDRFVRTFDPDTARAHLGESGSISFSEIFRTDVRHGQYAWKEYTLLKIDEDNDLLLVRNVHDIVKGFIADNMEKFHEGGPYSPEQLWHNLIHSGLIRLFWKDNDRRFLGVSQSFLDFYDFSSAEELIGKNDEEMGWHVHPDLYMNDEYKVIHEGRTFRNVHGKCMSHGENVDIFASKAPLYDVNGEIMGLLGFFIDIDALDVNEEKGTESLRRDVLTGLLNSRGISEDAEALRDEYYLRGKDFVRMHIGINDFNTINSQYGYDFGDKVLKVFGDALKKGLGLKSSVGRYAGQKFTVLSQIENRNEARALREKIKAIGDSVREVDGKTVTLYLSVGYAFYSEFLDMEELAKKTEMRLLADYDLNISAESRIEHALELFCMFDDLPVPYVVFRMTREERSGRYDAVFFYVNHKYEEFAHLPAKAMLGHTVREIFPVLGDDWYLDIKIAALDGKVMEMENFNPLDGKHYRFTARQIIYPGYCAITCVESPVIKERKQLLIADDVETNREILGDLLCDEYDICYASDGVEALETLRSQKGMIDLLLLDLYMPNMSGQEVMAEMQKDKGLKDIPVIVLTIDKEAELMSLKMGAMDFIPKPYPDIEIVKTRIAKCITLSQRR
ncbi:MAG: EAL domain-containing protein, partial [Lachnospiraceae bacterium]|nr:EAL domain-containing protein [Lachnospiraceae bacterium]